MLKRIKAILNRNKDKIEVNKFTKKQKKDAKELLKNSELKKPVHDPNKPGLI